MADQTSFRLPPEMLRALGRLARQRGIPKSQLVREALEQFLAEQQTPQGPQSMTVRERSAPYIGSISLAGSRESEDISVRIRKNNWRD